MRLIDADALKEYFFRPYSNEEVYSNVDIEEIIDNAPTVEPSWDEMLVICDNCGHAIHVKRCEKDVSEDKE